MLEGAPGCGWREEGDSQSPSPPCTGDSSGVEAETATWKGEGVLFRLGGHRFGQAPELSSERETGISRRETHSPLAYRSHEAKLGLISVDPLCGTC